ncbi:probable serine/threonine-protein kinase PBL28 [Rutidosis leptorrhynchoides]|uniref:probable serine/threonine-protein kinase PBL28 n=1 Tax=Rutidosis leptorrhynchoides TaxID=125765 RepID=UPI003A9984D2
MSQSVLQELESGVLESEVADSDKSLVFIVEYCELLRGGFGNVYKCTQRIGLVNEVALKRLQITSDQGVREFEAEIEVLSKLRHANLMSLIGYCGEGNEMVLAYEFMPNGNLQDHLHKKGTDLSWLQRLKICIGAARGLDYLHTGPSTQHGIIHRDVKTSNILLDAKFDAKISDFGLARFGPINQTQTFVSTVVKGTFGYMDPSYFFSGKLTRKSDVYAFGVVLFEVLAGRQAVDPSIDQEQWSLAVWVQDQIKDGKLNQIIDPRLIGQISKKSLKEFANIAAQCFHNQPKQCPTMAEIVVKLDSILLQERNTTSSVGDEVNFIDRLRNFFISKAVLTTPVNEIRPRNVQKSVNLIAEESSSHVEVDDSEDESLIVEVDDSQDENGSGDYDCEDGIELLPTIEGLQILGEAFPGNEIQASGYSTNGTTYCWFKWVRHLQDRSVIYIKDAHKPNYTVRADDVHNYLAIEVQPHGDRQ